MVANPNGMVVVNDGGCPRTFTGVAANNLTGGMFVQCGNGTTTAAVDSGLSSFKHTDIPVYATGSGLACNGIVLKTVSSGAEVTVATRGFYIVTAAGTIKSGYPVTCTGGDAVEPLGAYDASGAHIIGRALTGAGSEGYLIISLNC